MCVLWVHVVINKRSFEPFCVWILYYGVSEKWVTHSTHWRFLLPEGHKLNDDPPSSQDAEQVDNANQKQVPLRQPVHIPSHNVGNNNRHHNGYLQRLTHTGPKPLHISLNAHVFMSQCIWHACTQSYIRAMELKKSFFKRERFFEADLKELTEVEWGIELGS